jgi:hypothetical protein
MQALSQLSYTPVQRETHYREAEPVCKPRFALK